MIPSEKVAAYLDEAGDEPEAACALLARLGITTVCLRSAWSIPLQDATDQALRKLRDHLRRHNLRVAMIGTDIGQVPPHQLTLLDAARPFHLASYFGAALVQLHAGTATLDDSGKAEVQRWMATVTEQAIISNTTPLLELRHNSYLYKPAGAVMALQEHKRWKLLYDPVELCLRQRLDPFAKYWTLLRPWVAAIDVRDLKIGVGFRPAGVGDCNLGRTLSDAMQSGFSGYYILEPCLGRQYGGALSKAATFELAWNVWRQLPGVTHNAGN